MNLTAMLIEQALRRLQISESSIRQLLLASALSDPDGRGFPKELFQLSAPVVARGLLNFAVFQMNSGWLYPRWVRRQLDPASDAFTPRSQNPLFINTTHRSWTSVGTPNGYYEAIVDPEGIVTPLPREWSIDTWLSVDGFFHAPSVEAEPEQRIAGAMPLVMTRYTIDGIDLTTEVFAGETRRGLDVLFAVSSVKNISERRREIALCIAARPFGPEGVSPVFSAGFPSERILQLNGAPAIAFGETPAWRGVGTFRGGDLAGHLRKGMLPLQDSSLAASCDRGLGHAVAVFPKTLAAGEQWGVHYSVALGEEEELRKVPPKLTWRVSYDKRLGEAGARWGRTLAEGATFRFAPGPLKEMFDASRLALFELSDREFISPGPYLYHHFWFRDAVVMIRALDLLGYADRSRTLIDAFAPRMDGEGFFRGPEGEWDSNGAVLWLLAEHLRLGGSTAWARRWLPTVERAAQWIAGKRRATPNGLLPRSLSAEHLGTVDQYFWDSFWSLAGLRAARAIARRLESPAEMLFGKEGDALEEALLRALATEGEQPGCPLIPSAPGRGFDESAIGSICPVYPLGLGGDLEVKAGNSVRELVGRFVGERGFFHPIIHSGYNPYLTLQLAHALLRMGDSHGAWRVARTIFAHMHPPYSLPEAIHPKTGKGVMGDGHHGWAAAEIVLFIRDCLIAEEGTRLVLFRDGAGSLVVAGSDVDIVDAPTSFGTVTCRLRFLGDHRVTIELGSSSGSERRPGAIEIHLPFLARDIAAGAIVPQARTDGATTVLVCPPETDMISMRW